MLSSILLLAPTSLFITALPADSSISSRTLPTEAKAIVFALPRCTATDGARAETIQITRDICKLLPTSIQFLSYESGSSLNVNIDTTRLDCRIDYYRGSQCGGSSIGQTQRISAAAEPGPCVPFNLLPQVVPNVAVGANSAKLTCTPILRWGCLQSVCSQPGRLAFSGKE